MRIPTFSRDLQIIRRMLRELPGRIHRQVFLVGQCVLELRGSLSLRLVAVLRATRSRSFRWRLLRTLASLAIILSFLFWPEPRVTLGSTLDAASELALSVGSTVSTLRSVTVVLIPSGPIVVPVPLLPLWVFTSSTAAPRQLSMAERIARVSAIKVAPHGYVGYIGDTVTFVAMGTDIQGQPAHGAKFTWESSDATKLTIDEAGRATLIGPGLVTVTARAGLAIKTTPVLIRSTRRRMQTDAEWRADQDSLVASAGGETGIGDVLASLGERLVPTAYAQGGQGADYGNAAPIGQVGTPPFAALEETRLGPVMPQTNFELPLSLVDLGGRGLAASVGAYYNIYEVAVRVNNYYGQTRSSTAQVRRLGVDSHVCA